MKGWSRRELEDAKRQARTEGAVLAVLSLATLAVLAVILT